MYPSVEEAAVIQAAEKLMVTTMARYDPSHDAFHGQFAVLHFAIARTASLRL